ncbi:MAG: hypothetical protein R3D43_09325 [Tepidamorphaceae bacterium]
MIGVKLTTISVMNIADEPLAIAHDLLDPQTRRRTHREQNRGDRWGLLADAEIEADDHAEMDRSRSHL